MHCYSPPACKGAILKASAARNRKLNPFSPLEATSKISSGSMIFFAWEIKINLKLHIDLQNVNGSEM